MDLTRLVQNYVQSRRAITVAFRGFLSGSGLLVSESGIYCHILTLVVIVAMFILAASGLSISVPNLGGTGCIWVGIFAASQLSSPAQKGGHEGSKGCHSSWFVLAELPYKPFVLDTMLKGSQGFGIRTVNDLIFLGQEAVPKLSGRFSGLLCDAI